MEGLELKFVTLKLLKKTKKTEEYLVIEGEGKRIGLFNRVEYKNEVFLSLFNEQKEGKLLRTNILREGAASIAMFACFKWILPA